MLTTFRKRSSFQCRAKCFIFLIILISSNIEVETSWKSSSVLCDKYERCENSFLGDYRYSSTGCCSEGCTGLLRNDTGMDHFVQTLAGIRMPKLIYGTAWKKERTAELVIQAIRAGFRGIDTACQPKHYHEPGVGEALKILQNEDKIKREDLFIQTKFTSVDGQDPKNIPYDPDAELPVTVRQSLEASLRNLGTSYIDSLVMHSPMRTHRDTMEVWRVFEGFVDEGKVRQLGISNCYSLPNFEKIYQEARIKPAVLQNRFYAETKFDKGLRQFCKEKGIYYQSFWTLTANPQILSSTRVRNIAKKYGKTSPQILFTYLIQTGVVTPLTGTTSLQHMKDDLECLNLKLEDGEMAVFDSLINEG